MGLAWLCCGGCRMGAASGGAGSRQCWVQLQTRCAEISPFAVVARWGRQAGTVPAQGTAGGLTGEPGRLVGAASASEPGRGAGGGASPPCQPPGPLPPSSLLHQLPGRCCGAGRCRGNWVISSRNRLWGARPLPRPLSSPTSMLRGGGGGGVSLGRLGLRSTSSAAATALPAAAPSPAPWPSPRRAAPPQAAPDPALGAQGSPLGCSDPLGWGSPPLPPCQPLCARASWASGPGQGRAGQVVHGTLGWRGSVPAGADMPCPLAGKNNGGP